MLASVCRSRRKGASTAMPERYRNDVPAPESGGREAEAEHPRKLIHFDMDAFYASVEQRDNPELRASPSRSGRGARRSCRHELDARKFGVRSAMPSVTARRKCPGVTS
jgi:DNA polymerase-4